MGDTIGIINKEITVTAIIEFLKVKYEIEHIGHSPQIGLFSVYFRVGKQQRCITIHTNDNAKSDYKIDGTLLSYRTILSHRTMNGSIELITIVLEHFGGYIREDCVSGSFKKINFSAFRKTPKMDKWDVLKNKIVVKFGFENLTEIMSFCKEYKQLKQS